MLSLNNRFRYCRVLSTLFLSLYISACQTVSTHAQAESASAESKLMTWVDNTLAPYIAGKLASHPRFTGESYLLVSFHEETVQTEISALERRLRERLRIQLVRRLPQGMRWQPEQGTPEHHRQKLQMACEKRHSADYFIGFDLRTVGEQAQVNVAALDVGSKQWVGEFGSAWKGRLTAEEVKLASHLSIDETLRGLRTLPFDTDQPDLAADYLANNLGCLLSSHKSAEQRLFVDADGDPVLTLVGRYLARLSGVSVTRDRSQATVLLGGVRHAVSGGLQQLWVGLHAIDTGEHLPGLDTFVYLQQPAANTRPVVSREPVRLHTLSPSITGISVESMACPAGWSGPLHRAGYARCGRIQVRAEYADDVFALLYQAGSLFALDSTRCPQETRARRHSWVISYDRAGSDENARIYAIAVSDPVVRQRLAELMDELPASCDRVSREIEPEWLNRLDAAMTTADPDPQWRSIAVSPQQHASREKWY